MAAIFGLVGGADMAGAKPTSKEQSYINNRIKGMDPLEAYQKSEYKSDVMSNKVMSIQAQKIESKPYIALAIANEREKVAKKVGLTLEAHLTRLAELSAAAEKSDQFGAAITAETNRGKASGLYVEKVEQSGPGGKPIALTIERVIIDDVKDTDS
jgi:phage terminase small subunit